MRANTQKIFELLNRGEFLSVDSTDPERRRLYNDIEENVSDYEDYFREIGLSLGSGEGYYYLSRINESKLTIEQKLTSFSQWVDILDFLKTYDVAFSAGYHFRATNIIEKINLDVELRDKARKLFKNQNTHQDVVDKLVQELTGTGFAEIVNEQDGTYKITSAFHYAEDLVNLIEIYNEEEENEL